MNKSIYENYSKFNISKELIPAYTNPNDFAKNIKKCTVLKDTTACYSSSTNSNKK